MLDVCVRCASSCKTLRDVAAWFSCSSMFHSQFLVMDMEEEDVCNGPGSHWCQDSHLVT